MRGLDDLAAPDITIAGGALRVNMSGALQTPQACEIPSGLSWDQVNYPLTITSTVEGTGAVSLDPLSFFSGYASRPTYWVDVARPDDTGDGLTEATAKRTISAAVTLANTGGVAARIRVKAGFYNRNRNFSQGSIYPTVDIVFEAYNGRPNVTTAETGLTWTANATYAWVSQATRSSVSRVFDLKLKDGDGAYIELTKVADLVTVSATPNSWTEVAGVTYVNRIDRTLVTDATTMVLLAVDNLRMQGTSQQSILLVGETAKDGFDVIGGQSGAWRTVYTGGAGGTRKVHAAIGCTFRYSGHSTGSVGGVAVEGLNGLAFFKNCDASFGVTDCWNWHNALGASMYVLTVNCTGIRGGQFSYTSCNGWTGHDSVIAIDVCGYYDRNKGRTVHFIDSAKVFLAGTTLRSSLGDKAAGGTNEPGELTAENTVQMWADMCRIGQLAGQLAVSAHATAAVRLRRTQVRGISYAEAGASIASY